MRQSSVEWQQMELIRIDYQYAINKITPREYQEQTKHTIAQAKAMHKKEVIDAYHINPLESKWKNIGEQYYNETFKSE